MDTLSHEIQAVKLELSILSTTIKRISIRKPQDNPLLHVSNESPIEQPPGAQSTEVENSLDGSFVSMDEEIVDSLNWKVLTSQL